MYTPQQIEFIREYGNKELKFGAMGELEILGHPVEWHHVFAKLKEWGYFFEIFFTVEGEHIFHFYKHDGMRLEDEQLVIDISLSPMEQPTLIEELLKLKQ